MRGRKGVYFFLLIIINKKKRKAKSYLSNPWAFLIELGVSCTKQKKVAFNHI